MKLSYLNTSAINKPHAHGSHEKDLIVLHETVSQDVRGLSDITGVEAYLAKIGYGIHGMTDLEGNIAWAYNEGNAVFYQCGGVNERSIGIEQVSYIPGLLAAHKVTVAHARELWLARDKQLRATAKLIAAIHHAHPKIPLKASVGTGPGIASHWNVSQHFKESEGHTDCWPVNNGGYYPLSKVIEYAKLYVKQGVTL